MSYLKENFLKLLLVGCLGLTSLVAETNDFYNPRWANAWDSLGRVERSGDGRITVGNEIALLARLEIFEYFFQPHPFNNRYHDLMLQLEVDVEDARVELHMEKANNKRKKKAWFVVGLVGGFVVGLTPTVLIKIYKTD
jgi:hypothetical protein